MRWLRRALAVVACPLLSLAACTDDGLTAIDVVVSSPAPGLGVTLDRIRVVAERSEGGGRFYDLTPAPSGGALRPVSLRLSPERPDDAGRVVYRLEAQGLAGGAVHIARHHRIVFVPHRILVLPFRLESACVGIDCAGDTTCVEGRCVDDYLAACDLEGAAGSEYCRRDAGRAAPLDSGVAPESGPRDSGAEAGDAGADAPPSPADTGPAPPDAGPVCDCDDGLPCTVDTCDESRRCAHAIEPGACLIDGRCWLSDDRDPDDQCRACLVATDPSAWSIAAGFPCEDDLYCTRGERCDASGACVWSSGERLACWDALPCTMDVCDEASRACLNPPAPRDTSCAAGGSDGRCCNGICQPDGAPCF